MAKRGRKGRRDGNPNPEGEPTLDPITEWAVEAPLDADEVMRSFRSIGSTNGELRALRISRKDLNEEIKKKQGHLDELIQETETLRSKKMVKVKEVPDIENKRVAIVRLDNEETVSYRPMKGGELQAFGTLPPAQLQQTLAGVAQAAEDLNVAATEPEAQAVPSPEEMAAAEDYKFDEHEPPPPAADQEAVARVAAAISN